MNPSPLHWEQGVLTTGPPGRSLLSRFSLELLVPDPSTLLSLSFSCQMVGKFFPEKESFLGSSVWPHETLCQGSQPLRAAQLSHRARLTAGATLVGPLPAPQGPLRSALTLASSCAVPTPRLPLPWWLVQWEGQWTRQTSDGLGFLPPLFLACDLGQVTSLSLSFCF